MMRCLALTVMLATACGQDRIAVTENPSGDYNRDELLAAIDKFVAARRTPQAFGELAREILVLRPGMDRTVSELAERMVLSLALAPIRSVAARPVGEQVDALALTVWPILLSPEIEADEVLAKRDPETAALMPKPDEDVRGYLVRICGGPLVAECKQVVPEHQGAVVGAIATRRATDRARIAVADCVMCPAEAGWLEAVRGWEALDRMATSSLHELERRADPANWPTAGAAAQPDPGLPEAEVDVTGEIVIGGQRYGAADRIDALRELRGRGATLALHLRPELTLAQTKALLVDARKAGAAKVAVIARGSRYPWERRIYWLADQAGTRFGLRPTDSLQLLLDAFDHVAGPGDVARVD